MGEWTAVFRRFAESVKRPLVRMRSKLSGVPEPKFFAEWAEKINRLQSLSADVGALSADVGALSAERTQQREMQLPRTLPAELSRRCLFVVGCCRSGTSLLASCLNESPDVLLMGEANWHLHLHTPDFVARYNAMHRGFGNPRSKDTWLPPACPTDVDGFDVVDRLAQHYRWIGEKIAFGPHGKCGERSYQEVFFEYHAKYAYDATYFLISRRPHEVLLSAAKLFPEAGAVELMSAWLETLLIQIDLYRNFPRVEWLFYEELASALPSKCAKRLGIEFKLPEGAVSERAKQTVLAEGEVPEPFRPWSRVVLDMLRLDAAVRSEITAPCECRGGASRTWLSLVREAEHLLAAIDADESTSIESDALPILHADSGENKHVA